MSAVTAHKFEPCAVAVRRIRSIFPVGKLIRLFNRCVVCLDTLIHRIEMPNLYVHAVKAREVLICSVVAVRG